MAVLHSCSGWRGDRLLPCELRSVPGEGTEPRVGLQKAGKRRRSCRRGSLLEKTKKRFVSDSSPRSKTSMELGSCDVWRHRFEISIEYFRDQTRGSLPIGRDDIAHRVRRSTGWVPALNLSAARTSQPADSLPMTANSGNLTQIRIHPSGSNPLCDSCVLFLAAPLFRICGDSPQPSDSHAHNRRDFGTADAHSCHRG